VARNFYRRRFPHNQDCGESARRFASGGYRIFIQKPGLDERLGLKSSTETEVTLMFVDDHAFLITQPPDRGVTWRHSSRGQFVLDLRGL
jgi:hypothetical protein